MISKRAQSTIEYMVVCCIIVAAFVGMGAYIKRGLQGRLVRQGEDYSLGFAYAPGATNSSSTNTKNISEESHVYPKEGTLGPNRITVIESRVNIGQEKAGQETALPYLGQAGVLANE